MFVCLFVVIITDSKAFDTHDRPMAKSSISMTKSATLSDGHIDTSSFLVSNMANGKGQLGPASDQLLAVREAFSGDNVVEQFEREKAELEAQEMIEDSPTVLPGLYPTHLQYLMGNYFLIRMGKVGR